MKYQSLDQILSSPAYAYYRKLGYTQQQSVTLIAMELSERDGGYTAILNAFDTKPSTDARTFTEFFSDYVFDRERFRADGYTETPAEERPQYTAPSGGVPWSAPRQPKKSGGLIRDLLDMLSERKRMMRYGSPAVDRQQARIEPLADMLEPAFSLESMPIPDASGAAAPAPGPFADDEFEFDFAGEGLADMAQPLAGFRMAGFAPEQMLSDLPGLEDLRTDSYETIEEKEMREVTVSPTATFRTTYNTAAASILLANIRNRTMTNHSMVRTEELLNYLHYDLKKPEDQLFETTCELKQENGRTMLFLGIQGKRILPQRQNICFLLDVSGSMDGRSDDMVMSMMTVLAKMNDGDIFSLVTYSSTDKVVINGLKLKKADLDDVIYTIMRSVFIEGCTYGSAGINKAYEIVERNMIQDGVNRVILLTDGDLNFGITEKGGLIELIEKKKTGGAYFSAIGTGIWNLQDDKLEALAKNGNGNYFVINCQEDIERNILNNYESLVFPIARNVKAQVEFNPAKVARYRLIGYERRMLNHEDFRNDKVIAEPFGSGSACIALFELELRGDEPIASNLKYQTVQVTDSDELASLTLRWQEIESDDFHECCFPIGSDLHSTGNIDKAIECMELADKLRAPDPDEMTRRKLIRFLEE